jgi:bacillopeptidase F
MTASPRMRKLLYFFLPLALIFLTALAPTAHALAPDLQAALESLDPDGEIPVIITLSDKVDFTIFEGLHKGPRRSRMITELKSRADISQRPLKAFLEGKGAKKLKPLWIINGIAVIARADVIRELAGQPGIEDIKLDAVVYAPQVNYETSSLPEWNLDMIQAPEIWNLGYQGEGVVIASMDTGVDLNHPDLQSRWRGGTNSWFNPFSINCTVPDLLCTPCNANSSFPCDVNGHGTQTTGIMVGGDAGGTAIGVAPEAKWIAVKIFNDDDIASYSVIHQGFQWLLDPDGNPDTDDAPDIVNNSWGLNNVNTCSSEFQTDIQTLKAANIAVVFSAGNSGPYPSTSVSPANNHSAFAVGAVDSAQRIAPFSSRGPSACDGDIFPEVVAPGLNIRTSDLTSGGIFPNFYATVSGTSFSSAHVAGAMALLLNAFPDANVNELEAALKQSASDLGMPGKDNVYGYGLIDLGKAYNLLVHPIPEIEALPPSYDFGTTKIGRISSSKIVTITNQGTTGLVIGTISITGSDSSEFRISVDTCSEKAIGSLSTCKIEVVFSPSSKGVKSADLSVPSNDPDTPTLDVSLSGAGVQGSYNAVALLTPNGGEVMPSGSTYTIRWGAPALAVKFRLLFSLDKGLTWNLITPTPITGTSYNWAVPIPFGNKKACLVKVIGYQSSNIKVGGDSSDAPFTIEVVKITSPDGREILESGKTWTITWKTNRTKRPVAKTKLFYSTNGGTTWSLITTPPYLTGDPGSYFWTAPTVTKTKSNSRVRIELKDEFGNILGADVSDSYFEIKVLNITGSGSQ